MNRHYPNLFNYKLLACSFVLLCYSFYNPSDSASVKITHNNLDTVLASHEVVFVNFYADWCKYSAMFTEKYDGAADEVSKSGYDPTKIVIGKVEGSRDIAARFHLSKYPTLKVFYNGLPSRKEYRGRRSVEALAEFFKKQISDPIVAFESLTELQELADSKRHIIAYMDSRDQPEYEVLRKVATGLRDDCLFHVGFGDVSQEMHPPDEPVVVFRPDRRTSVESDETFVGKLANFDEFYSWAEKKCIPLVREITFENAEELIEERLPFLILFHNPSDTESVKKYKQVVQRELVPDKQYVHFLTADGVRFEHPVRILGKSITDLPLIAIDTFRHMFLFPNYNEMEEPGRLKQFLLDLYSDKLHRELHNGPDHVQKGSKDIEMTKPPPESTFKKLAPSKNRYTLLRDEL